MGVRKNAKFLTAAEREAFARACISMKADLVTVGADRFSRWEQFVATHRLIQDADTPTATHVNFGHGGSGCYGFLAWHRYFLHVMEQRLQSYVPGVMIPYWDWTDPRSTIAVEDFLSPDGDPTSSYEIRRGYFAREAPGTGANTTPAPAWWPAALTGWNLHSAFGFWAGALRRRIGPAASLPSAATLRALLDLTTYPDFQYSLETGGSLLPFNELHNGLHPWFGGPGHMRAVEVSPFDPMFYLHHCNIDRLWAMWQMDGHAGEYPMTGGNPGHNRGDPMFPWVGSLTGYSSHLSFAPVTMPDFSSAGVVTPADVLDHRALGYSYDTQAVVGIALDRTGSMMGMTPDPMTTPAPDVTKWEAAKRGVSAFLQDCEAAYAAAENYVVAGIKTFRQLSANDFAPVFPGTPYGLIKPGGSYGTTTFDALVAPLTPGGGTPLADALSDAYATLVAPPFGWLPAGERRYLMLFTDGVLTAGSPLISIPDGSLAHAAVFTMGFGTGADVDYPTLAAMTAKGEMLGVTQVFHGENAGAIDKFYSQSLAAAIGFTPIMDPVLELHQGEHTHLFFNATSADDVFFLTVQGQDFADENWSFQLIGPDGGVAYTDGRLRGHAHGGGGHVARAPLATARRRAGRLSLFLRRDNADDAAWIGTWTLLVAWKARALDAMTMFDEGDLMVPVAAGPVRGARYARLLVKPARRIPARAAPGPMRHRLDLRPTSTNLGRAPACSVVVNIFARTRLAMHLLGEQDDGELTIELEAEALRGSIGNVRALARLIAPANDLAALVKKATGVPRPARLDGSDEMKVDAARVLAKLERSNPKLAAIRDEELILVSHHGSALHVHVPKPTIPGVYHVGMWIEGLYDGGKTSPAGHQHGAELATAQTNPEWFTRILAVSIGVPPSRPTKKRAVAPKRATKKTKPGRRK